MKTYCVRPIVNHNWRKNPAKEFGGVFDPKTGNWMVPAAKIDARSARIASTPDDFLHWLGLHLIGTVETSA